MQTVLEQGSIDKPLTFDVGLIQLSFIPVCSLNTCSQIVPRVCTSVLFIAEVLVGALFGREDTPSLPVQREARIIALE